MTCSKTFVILEFVKEKILKSVGMMQISHFLEDLKNGSTFESARISAQAQIPTYVCLKLDCAIYYYINVLLNPIFFVKCIVKIFEKKNFIENFYFYRDITFEKTITVTCIVYSHTTLSLFFKSSHKRCNYYRPLKKNHF